MKVCYQRDLPRLVLPGLQICLFQLLPNSEKSQQYNLEAISNEVDCSKTKKLFLNPPKTQKNVKMTAGRQAPGHDWLTSDWLGEDLEEEHPLAAR